MSNIMEKTLASIPKLLTQSFIGGGGGSGGGGASKMHQRKTPSMEIQTFMKNVHRARSKSHEAHIVNSELSDIKQKWKKTDLGLNRVFMRNSFTKVLFCHLLGYDVKFIGIEAIKLASQGCGYDKLLGYLVSCLLLSRHDSVTLLMMSTILKDMNSHNMLEKCIALKVAGEMVEELYVSSILPEVIRIFTHPSDLVREKAIHCFGSFYRNFPEHVEDSDLERLNAFLTSRDPGILMAVMNIFVDLTSDKPSTFMGLGLSFLHILDQINNRGFGSNYYYQMTPLPWLQIALLKVLGNIGSVDSQLSARVCPLLKSLIEKTKVSVPISLAVLVECILTAIKIQPNEVLLQLCSRCIAKLVSSDSNEDMRYQGLGLLIALSKVKQSFVSQHQVAIVECLTNQDHAIQSRTTLLLHAMANRANVKAICSKLFEQLTAAKESSFQQDILMMISDLAERFAPNVDWYVSTNLNILSHNIPQGMQDKVVDLVLTKVKDITGLIDKASTASLTQILFTVLDKNNYTLPEFSLSIQLFGTLAPILPEDFSSERFLNIVSECLCESVDKGVIKNTSIIYSPDYFSDKSNSHSVWDKSRIRLELQCVMAVTKMVLCYQVQPSFILHWLDTLNYKNTVKNSFIRNNLEELEDLAKNPHDLEMKSTIFLQDNSDIDFSLSFLDALVVKDMLGGNDCFKPSYVKKNTLSQVQGSSSSSLSAVLDEKDNNNSLDNSIMSESQMSESKRKIPSKWKDDDGENDEWNITGGSESSEKFVLVDSDDKHLEELNKKKKAADELFAGLNELSCDNDTPDEFSMINSSLSVSALETKRPKSIWDDDDEEDEQDHRQKQSIFNVGHIGINPFGISKKSKAKSTKWGTGSDFVSDQKLSGMDDAGIPIKPLESLNNNNNNNNNSEFQDSLYSSSSLEPHIPSTLHTKIPSSYDEPWSDEKESLSSVPETILSSLYSKTATDSETNSLAGSAVDALTDSDPEATDV